MELPLYEIRDEDFYDVSKRTQIIAFDLDELKTSVRKSDRALFAKCNDLSKMYLELIERLEKIEEKLNMKPKQATIYELFGGERAV